MLNKAIPPSAIRQMFIILLIVWMGSLIFEKMLPYFSGVLGAITIYVLLRKFMQKLLLKGWSPNIAATFLLILSFIGILIPVTGIVLLLSNKISNAASNYEKVLTALNVQLSKWEYAFGVDLSAQIDGSAVSEWLTEGLQSLAGGTVDIIISIGIMYFLLFYMLTNRSELRKTLFEYIPISNENLKIIGKEANIMVRSNALGIPLVALAQGIIALIGFLIFGTPSPFFWFVMVAVGSMIPFVGSLLGIVPVVILAFSNGNSFQAWGILLYGIIVVGSTDNIIRLFVLKKLDNVHPLITLVGVIVGVPLFGFIGLIFGPLLISLFLIVVKIYKKEYGKSEEASELDF